MRYEIKAPLKHMELEKFQWLLKDFWNHNNMFVSIVAVDGTKLSAASMLTSPD